MKLRLRRTFFVILMLCLQTAVLCSAAEKQSVLVRTAPLKNGQVVTSVSSYGVVTVDPRNTVTISFPRAGRVARILVSPGQMVRSGEPLVTFATDPSAVQGFRQASTALELARGDLVRAESMAAQKLVTQSQLAAARKAVSDAEAILAAQRHLGMGCSSEQSVAPFAGIVTVVGAKEGDLLAAGAQIMQLSRRGALTVVLGVEPEDSTRIRTGMPVRIFTLFKPQQAIVGTVREVHGLIDPQTRLVDVVVGLSGRQAARLIPGIRLRGEITIATSSGWLVPRSSVLRDTHGEYLYQVKGGRAHRVGVTTGVEQNEMIEVRGKLDPYLKVVTVGNYELSDGMALREEVQ